MWVRGAVALVALGWGFAPAAHGAVELRTLSGRADLVSGGDALVEVRGAGASRAQVFAGGRDVTDAFARRPGGRFAGLVSGLPLGRTVLEARLPDGRGARLAVRNHPRSGPLFAGPQTRPWLCLEPGLGADCAAPTSFRFVYRSTNPAKPGFQAYDPAAPPADVARATTDQGRSVPFVVRIETGTMDRALYNVAVLYDPARPWSPWSPQPGWNGKVLWPFGGDCKPWHKQDTPVDPLGAPRFGAPEPTGADEAMGAIFGNGNAPAALARGFAVATSAHNKLGSQCNTVVSAEAITMLKEHLRETLGPIRYTIGAGGSGGAMQQQQIASAYPGLLDGLQPAGSFPDLWIAFVQAQDCHLLNRYFDTVSPHLWAVPGQQEAVTGYQVNAGCRTQFDGPTRSTPVVGNYAAMWMDPANEAGCGLPAEQVYDPQANPRGVRCTIADYMVSVFGRRAADGFANRPYDNTGVQYGLRALQSGRITPEQFVDLNEKVGGLDIDWRPQAGRSAADRAALDVAYRGGLVTNGRELAKVPMIDIRGHDNVEIHSNFHSYAMRARLDRDAGGHDNQVIWMGARPLAGDPYSFNAAFDVVDRWLAAVERDRSGRPIADKVRRARPADAQDACWVEGRRITDASTCRAAFPHYGDPRIAAGAPLTDDALKCRLRPLDREEYPAELTAAQLARLRQVFPAGVCDHARPGVAQRAPDAWTSYAAGPGGRALGPPPRSTSYGRLRGTQVR